MPAPHPAPLAPSPAAPEVLDRREGPYGEVVLRRHGGCSRSSPTGRS